MNLSIIIVNWKSVEYLQTCIRSIYDQDYSISYEIVVIDNASFDGCDKMLSNQFPKVRFIQSKTNLGFAGANNEAFCYSTGLIVCFLNPDTIIHNNALQTLYDALIATPNAGAVGARLFNRDETVQTSCVMSFPTILNQALDLEVFRRIFPKSSLFGIKALFTDKNYPQEVEALSGACIMVKRIIFEQTGMFSYDYFMYAEDLDLCYKIRASGARVLYINTAQIVHLGGGSSNNLKNRLFGAILMRESNYLFLRKFKGMHYALAARIVFLFSGFIRLAVMSILLVPAVAGGHALDLLKTIARWWHLVLWAAGIERWPSKLRLGGAP